MICNSCGGMMVVKRTTSRSHENLRRRRCRSCGVTLTTVERLCAGRSRFPRTGVSFPEVPVPSNPDPPIIEELPETEPPQADWRRDLEKALAGKSGDHSTKSDP